MVNYGSSKIRSFDVEGDCAAYVCRGVASTAELADKTRKYARGDSFLLLLDRKGVKLERLLPAYVNAVVRHRDRIARANSLGMEMLLLVSGDTNIKKAIDACGARDGREFIVFSSDKSLIGKFLKENRLSVSERLELTFDFEAAGDIATMELFED